MLRLRNTLDELSKEELIELVICYDRYVVNTLEEEQGTPVCLDEFYTNEFQDYVFDENGNVRDVKII